MSIDYSPGCGGIERTEICCNCFWCLYPIGCILRKSGVKKINIQVERKCTSCGSPITVTALNIMQRLCMVDGDKNKQLEVTFCKCGSCHEVNVLQMDDVQTMEDLKRLTLLIGKNTRSRVAVSRDKQKDREKANKIHERMERRRLRLMEENAGHSLIEARNKKILVKCLTKYEGHDIINM